MSAVDDKPRELLMTALVRARHCQLLGEALKGRPDHVFFTVGLLSVVDALVDMPMADLLQTVPLTDVVKTALLEHEGPSGRALQAAVACEQGDFEGMRVLDFDPDVIQRCYVQALAWALESHASLLASGSPAAKPVQARVGAVRSPSGGTTRHPSR
jgi:EAL and modified HD-GYP domain-containing signal transduction protein